MHKEKREDFPSLGTTGNRDEGKCEQSLTENRRLLRSSALDWNPLLAEVFFLLLSA